MSDDKKRVTEEQAPRVKQLEWQQDGSEISSETPLGWYAIDLAGNVFFEGEHIGTETHASLKAKEIAQAHFEALDEFKAWFTKTMMNPDGGFDHLPDFLEEDMRLAWDAGRAALEASRSPVSQKEAVPVAEDLRAEVLRLFKANGMENDERLAIIIANYFATRSPVPSPAGEPAVKAADRLYSADEPMADGEVEMTAAENVLAWLIIEKIGVPDDRNYSPNEAQEILVRRLDYANEMENERIRSALHHSPTPVSAPVGVVEALEKAIALLWEHCEGIAPRIEPLEAVLEAALRSPAVVEGK